jgi:branched-chain amino acid transport system permease protein
MSLSPELLLEQVINGLLVGSFYIILSLGLSLIFSLGGVVNLAHGAFYAVGAYVAIEVEKRAGFFGAAAFSPVVVGIIGIAVERLFLSHLYSKDPALGLLFTFGLAMTIEQALRMIWGTTGLPFAIPPQLRGVLHVGDFIASYYRLAILSVTAFAVTACWMLLNRTSFGMVVRAGVRDPEMVRAMGISLKPALAAVFALGVGLAALAGVMSAPLAGVQPAMGSEILTATFVVVVIGGLGSFWGVVLAGLLVGVVRGVTLYFYPPMAEASMYLLMVLVLLLRPRGLLGERFEKFE